MDPQNERLKQLQDVYKDILAVEEIEKQQKIIFYRPIGKQPQFHYSDAINTRLVLGSNRSGKSISGVVESVSHALGYRPWLMPDDPNYHVKDMDGLPIRVPNIGRIVAQNFRVAIKQTIWPLLQEWIPKNQLKHVQMDQHKVPVQITFKNGSIIYIMSHEQDDMVFEGTKGDWAWFDEPPPYNKYIGIKRGLVDLNGKCWLTMTPLNQPWIAEVIYKRAGDPNGGVKVLKYDIWDNAQSRGGYVPDSAIDEFIKDMRDDEKEARLYGNFLHLAGRVFKEWKPEPPYWVPPFELKHTWPRVCLIDPHPRKPIAVMWVAVTPDNQYIVYRELYDKDLLTVADVAAKMKELEQSDGFSEPIAMRVIDTSANQTERSSGLTIKQEFAKHGIYCADAYKVNKEAGLNAIHEQLKIRGDWQEPGIVTFNTCHAVKDNWMFYCYDDWRTARDKNLKGEKQETRKIHDDFMDLLRYMFQKHLDYNNLRGLTSYANDEPNTMRHTWQRQDEQRRSRVGYPGWRPLNA